MKKIALIYRNRENMDAIYHLEEVVESIFGNYANIENYYANDLSDRDSISADVYVLVDRSILANLRTHTTSFKNIVILTRSIRKDNLSKIMEIPKNEDVLIVNDVVERTIETASMLYELGIGHLNFIIYNPDEDDGRYDKIKYAIVPNELDLVPKHIKNVINVGCREIGFDTIMRIKNSLGIVDDELGLKLLQYISTIVEPQNDLNTSYVENFLRNSMLNEYLYDIPSALILVSNEGQIIYANRRAREFFEKDSSGHAYYISAIDREIFKAIDGKETKVTQQAYDCFLLGTL